MSYMIQNSTIWRIAAIFFQEPTKQHYLKEISRRTRIAHTSVAVHLRSLIKQGIIIRQVERRGARSFPLYAASQNEEFRFYKKIYNIIALKESGLIPYLKDNYTPSTIVLFGSYARGEDTDESDIDIFLQAEGKAIDLSKFKRRLHRAIQLHIVPSFFGYSPELRTNIINGVVLSGYLDDHQRKPGSR